VQQATVAHHTTPHKGDWNLFLTSTLQSLCKMHHDSIAKSIEARGYDKTIGHDGWPLVDHLKNKS